MLHGLLIQGVLIGLGAAVRIGPVNVEIARRTLRGGFAAGFLLGCGAVTVDCGYAIVSSLGIGHLTDRPVVYWPFLVGGIALLAFLGIMSLREAWRAMRRDPIAAAVPTGAGNSPPNTRSNYIAGLLMTLVNPMTLAFWFVSLPALLGSHTQRGTGELPMLCLGVCIGAVSWVCFFTTILTVAGRWRRPWWSTAADAIGGIILLGFALRLVISAFASAK